MILPSQLISTYTLIVSGPHPPPLRFCSCLQPCHWPDRLLRWHDCNSLLLGLLNKSLPILQNLVQNPDACISSKPHSFQSFISFIHSFSTSPHPIATELAFNQGQNRPKDPTFKAIHNLVPPSLPELPHSTVCLLLPSGCPPSSSLTPTWCSEHVFPFLKSKLKTYLFNSPTPSIHPSIQYPILFVECSFIFCTILILYCNLLPCKESLNIKKALIKVILLLLLMRIMMLMYVSNDSVAPHSFGPWSSNEGWKENGILNTT